METITKTKGRRVTASDGGYVVVICEAFPYASPVTQRRAWDEDRIHLTRAEIAALAAKFPVESKPLPPVDTDVIDACRKLLAVSEKAENGELTENDYICDMQIAAKALRKALSALPASILERVMEDE